MLQTTTGCKKQSEHEKLDRILMLLEEQKARQSPGYKKVYDNKEIMSLLNIKDKYLKKIRDLGYLAYSREGDKYWYTQEDVDRFLKRFHHRDFARGGREIL